MRPFSKSQLILTTLQSIVLSQGLRRARALHVASALSFPAVSTRYVRKPAAVAISATTSLLEITTSLVKTFPTAFPSAFAAAFATAISHCEHLRRALLFKGFGAEAPENNGHAALFVLVFDGQGIDGMLPPDVCITAKEKEHAIGLWEIHQLP